MIVRIKETQEGLDTAVLRQKYRELSYYKKLVRRVNKAQHKYEHEFLSDKISKLKMEAKQLASMVFKVSVNNGKKEYYEIYSSYPNKESLLGVKKAFRDKMKEHRALLKKTPVETKSALGFSYETVGGVFQNKGGINAIAAGVDSMGRIRKEKIPDKRIMSNYVGIEIEFAAKVDTRTLQDIFIYAGLAGYVNFTTDGSIKVEHPNHFKHELRILAKEDLIQDVISRSCLILNHSSIGGYVNSSCGIHVHLDARNRDAKVVYNNLVKTQPMLKDMLPQERVNNRYCVLNITTEFSEATIDFNRELAKDADPRYQAINPTSFNKYKTIEVRMHSGSLNAVKISNWTSILMLLANKQTSIANNIHTSVEFKKQFPEASDKLVKYIENRTELFKKKEIDTKADHALAM